MSGEDTRQEDGMTVTLRKKINPLCNEMSRADVSSENIKV